MEKVLRRKRRKYTHKQLTTSMKNDIIARWVGTPYGHRECRPGRGVDCVHLAAAILSEIGIDIPIPGYQRLWRINDPLFFDRELNRISQRWKRVTPSQVRFGDIGLIRAQRVNSDGDQPIQHCFVIVDKARVIHILDDSLPQVRVEERSKWDSFVDKYIRFEH